MDPEHGWEAHSKLILTTLEELKEEIHELRKENTEFKVNLAMLNVKASVWGLMGGAIPLSLAILMKLI